MMRAHALSTKLLFNLVLNAMIGVLASWVVAEFYERRSHRAIPISLLVLVVVVQCWLTLGVKSDDERLIELHREAEKKRIRATMDMAAVVDERIAEAIRRGNLKEARQWQSFKDKHKLG